MIGEEEGLEAERKNTEESIRHDSCLTWRFDEMLVETGKKNNELHYDLAI